MTVLQETLDQVRRRIRRHATRELNEQNTKAALIEPVLRALEWDLEDLEEVSREYKRKRQDNPVDYALFVLRTPRLFIEAKALGRNLGERKWANQIMGYAAVAGVKWVALTDGNEYRLYNSHATVDVDKKLFRTFKLTDEGSSAAESLALLSKGQMRENRIDVLWKAYFVDRRVKAVLDDLLSGEPDVSLVRLIRKRTSNLSLKEIRASLTRAQIQLDFPIEPSALVPPRRPGTAPGRKKVSGKKEADTKKAYGVTVKDLIAAGLLRPPVKLERLYKGQHLTARIGSNGRVTFGKETVGSVSHAGGLAKASVRGLRPGEKLPATAGWRFWKVKDTNGELVPLHELRLRHIAEKDS